MSGVGSTNVMKKGSANNPFLAFSEADMKGYLNSAYTGCIVKYNGDPIARKITFETANVPERAQNLVFTKNAPTFGDYGFGDLVITKKQNGSTTTEYLRCAYCNLLTGLIGPLSSGTPSGDNYVKFIGLFSSNINTSNSNLIRACWVPDAIDSKYEYPDWWPVTPGWQEDFVNTEGKVVEWGYGEDVSFTYAGDSDAVLLLPCVITPYEVGELYKVVYSNNEYRYEEFHCISEDKTTAGVEDVAPGKTFYDFTGTKQIGTGTRANPFLARSDADMNAFNNATYLGKFVKYIGKTNDTYVKDAIYQVTNDTTEYDRYMLLPTLENEGKASDLAPGKQLINSKGEIVVGVGSEETKGDYTVKVIDYDGTVLLEKKGNTGDVIDLPTAPTHDKLVFQEWSACVAVSNNKVTIADNDIMVGAVYTTVSGQNEFDITLTKVTGLSVTLKMDGTKDWGDGTSDTATSHTYTAYGDYTIKCNGTTMTSSTRGGLFGQKSNSINYYCTAARFATVTRIDDYAFQYCYSLMRVVIPNGVTILDEGSFSDCNSLISVVIPISVTRIGISGFYNCNSLMNIVIPNGAMRIGSSAFYQCNSLTSIVIPNSVTSVGANVFYGCYSLAKVIISSNVTIIDSSWLYQCSSLTKVIISNGVTSIGGSAFGNCYGLTKYDFSQCASVPVLSYTNAFSGINKIAKIIVPDSLYDEWIAASNWSTYADYIYKASEVTQ